MNTQLYNLCFVLCGSALGGASRHLLLQWTSYSSILVNLAGCFVYGLLFGILDRYSVSEGVKLFLFIGLLGGFTTFSSYVAELHSYAAAHQWLKFIAHMVMSNVSGLALFVVGGFMSKWLLVRLVP